MEEEVILNNNGLKVKYIIKDNNISFSFDKNVSFFEKLIRVEDYNDYKYVYLGWKKILRIRSGKVESVVPVTNTDIKILRAIYNNMICTNTLKDIIESFKAIKVRVAYTIFNNINTKTKNKIELHTNLISLLNHKEFINFINKYDITYPMNFNGELDFGSDEYYTYKDILFNGWKKKLYSSIKLDKIHVDSYSESNINIKNREKLLKRVAESLEKKLETDKEWIKSDKEIKNNIKILESTMSELDELKKNGNDVEKNNINYKKEEINSKLGKLKTFRSSYCLSSIYNDLFDYCISKLLDDRIDYSIISFSNDKRLKYISDNHKNDKRFKILFGIDRVKSIDKFSDISKSLEMLLNDNTVIGVDITGLENETDYGSLKEKMEWLIPVLHIHPSSILKLRVNESNAFEILNIINELSEEINDSCIDLFGEGWGVLPPPNIRIEYFNGITNNRKLVKLIKEFDVQVEVNILNDNAINECKKENIKYVLVSSDRKKYNKIEDNKTNPNLKLEELIKTKIANTEKEKNTSDVKTYYDAINMEDEKFGLIDGKALTEVEKVNFEIDRTKKYIDENKIIVDEDYFNRKMNLVIKHNLDNQCDFAKVYLYLLQKELLPNMETYYKTLDYLSSKNSILRNDIEKDLKKIFDLIKEIYKNDTKDYRNSK